MHLYRDFAKSRTDNKESYSGLFFHNSVVKVSQPKYISFFQETDLKLNHLPEYTLYPLDSYQNSLNSESCFLLKTSENLNISPIDLTVTYSSEL